MLTDFDTYQISIKLILKNSEGKILVLDSATDPKNTMAGFWDIPGGRIDVNERGATLEQVLRREIAEEIGAVHFTTNMRIVGVGKRIVPARPEVGRVETPVMYLVFEGAYVDGDIQISDEHKGFIWINPHELDPQRFVEGFRDSIAMYLGQ